MRDVVIDKKGCRLSFDRKVLILHHNSFHRPLTLPFGQIQSLTIVSGVELDSTLLTKLAHHKIAVVILANTPNSNSCFIQGKWHAGVARRQAQYDIVRDERLASYWANTLIRFKVHRQSQLIQRLSGDPSAIEKLNDIKHKLSQEAFDLARLRGIEGMASAIYFGAYQDFFDKQLHFHRRSRRPPLDPVNVILSLSYTLLQSIYEHAVYAVGFDPYLGVLHEISHGRASLACDFTELQRCYIDHWVWQLFDHQILSPSDFSMTDNTHRPCELLKVGRNRFYTQFSQIKPMLQKNALRQVWLFQKRISRHHEQRLNFISELDECTKTTF